MLEYEYNYNDIFYKISVGKNKNENWNILDNASENDIWFHINNLPSCHVILHIPDKNIKDKIDNRVIKYVAEICKENSKYKNFKKIIIIYTKVKNVKKTKEIGCVITKLTKKIIV